MAEKRLNGFTLAELLVALLILGQIATFTIPKILSSQQKGSWNAASKEVVATISAAYQTYSQAQSPTAATKPADLIPYINYVKYDTASTIDSVPGQTSRTCSATTPCLKLHNGGMLYIWEDPFGATTSNRALYFMFDPDGIYSGSSSSSLKSIYFVVYFNGRVTSQANIIANTCYSYLNTCENPGSDPSWFSW